jgi:hypothetical protein
VNPSLTTGTAPPGSCPTNGDLTPGEHRPERPRLSPRTRPCHTSMGDCDPESAFPPIVKLQRAYSVLIFSSLSRVAAIDSSIGFLPLIHAAPSLWRDWRTSSVTVP